MLCFWIDLYSVIAGVARSTVFKVLKEYKSNGALTQPKQSSGRRSLVNNFDESVKNAVRQVIHSFFYNNEAPTLNKIFNKIQNHSNIPQMSRSSLYLLMKKINFK